MTWLWWSLWKLSFYVQNNKNGQVFKTSVLRFSWVISTAPPWIAWSPPMRPHRARTTTPGFAPWPSRPRPPSSPLGPKHPLWAAFATVGTLSWPGNVFLIFFGWSQQSCFIIVQLLLLVKSCYTTVMLIVNLAWLTNFGKQPGYGCTDLSFRKLTISLLAEACNISSLDNSKAETICFEALRNGREKRRRLKASIS